MRFHHPIIDGFLPYKPPPWKPPPWNILHYRYSTLLLTFAIFRTITYKTIFNSDVYPLRIFLSDKNHYHVNFTTTTTLSTTTTLTISTTLIFRHPFIDSFLMIFTTPSLPTISTTIIFCHPFIIGFMPMIFHHPFINGFMPMIFTTTTLPTISTTIIFRHTFIDMPMIFRHSFIDGFMLMIFTTTTLPTISTTIIFHHPLIDGFMPMIFSHPFIDGFIPSKQLPRSPLYRCTTIFTATITIDSTTTTNTWGDMISSLYESECTNITTTNTTTTTTTITMKYITTNTIPVAFCVISNNTNAITQYFSTTNNNNNINNCSTSPNLGDVTAHQTKCVYYSGHISHQQIVTPSSLSTNTSLHSPTNNKFESTTYSQHE